MAGADGPPMVSRVSSLQFSHVFTTHNTGRIDEFYTIASSAPLGEGSYGKVFHGTSKTTGQIRAIKTIDTSKITDPKRFQDEVAIQMELDHPNIVKLYEVFKDAKYIYLVMELCEGGELFDRIVEETEKHEEGEAFCEADAANYMKQILGAMTYLNAKQYCHRDIKPENFLLQNKSADSPLKVIDFGLAKRFRPGQMMSTKAGTPYYVAPEVLQCSYGPECDIWGCGVMCYILLCGYPPFFGDNDAGVLRMVRAGKFSFPSPDWDRISPAAKDFITQMLTYAPASRPSAAALLEHTWFNCAPSRHEGHALPRDMGCRLKQFRTSSKLKRVALTLIAQQLKDSDIQDLQKTFAALDKNLDGTLSPVELREGMLAHGIELPPDLAEIIANLDTDGSGCIDYTEFIAATMTKRQYMQKDVLWSAFRTFDIDGDGCITKKELMAVLKNLTLDLADRMVSEVDLDGNGSISFEEFCEMMNAGPLGSVVASSIAGSAEGRAAAP